MAVADKMSLAVMVAVVMTGMVAAAGRYKTCDSGCCQNEFCAYDSICYPISKCTFGCPDGECVQESDDHKACVPQAPCKSSFECSAGHSCTMNYNLGYAACQYSLGGALCRRGVPGEHGSDAAADTWKRSFLARWRGKSAYVKPGRGNMRG